MLALSSFEQPVDEQVEIIVGASNGQKVILKHKKQQGGGGSAPGGSSRLMAMKVLFYASGIGWS